MACWSGGMKTPPHETESIFGFSANEMYIFQLCCPVHCQVVAFVWNHFVVTLCQSEVGIEPSSLREVYAYAVALDQFQLLPIVLWFLGVQCIDAG